MAKTALITGASGGIGEELARVFAREGYDVVLVARSADKLEALAAELRQKHGITARVTAQNLTAPGAAEAVFAAMEGTPPDVLVNNAGYAAFGPFVESDLSTQLDMMQLNMVLLTHLTRLFLPGMVARRSGYVMNVASTAAFQPGPLMAVYYATKAYVLSFSEALASELNKSGVKVSALCPGPTQSGFQDRAAMGRVRLLDMGLMPARDVAEQGYRGMMKGQRVVVTGLRNKLFALSMRFAPRALATWVVKYAHQHTGH